MRINLALKGRRPVMPAGGGECGARGKASSASRSDGPGISLPALSTGA